MCLFSNACYIWRQMAVKHIDTNAIIVGAGPAGAATSIYLSKAGIDHVILDKEHFPRDKVCGDACSGKTAYVIRNANPAWMREIFANENTNTPNHGIIFVAPNGKPLSIPFKPNSHEGETAPGFTAKRLDFDNFLFEKLSTTHCSIFQNTRVSAIDRKDDVTVHFTSNGEEYSVTAPVIVGADGDKSIVRKKFLPEYSTDKTSAVGLRAYYKGVTGMNPGNYIELHFLPEVLPGYFWIFPLPNGMANIGVGIMSERIRAKKINLREKMLKAIETSPTIAPRFKNAQLEGKILGWGLPMGMEQAPVSGERFLLTGDAASLVDPFSGEGIGNAMYSGMLAARSIEEAHKAQQFDADFLKASYDKPLYKRLGDELRIGTTMQKLCRYPWLFNFVVNKAHKSPSLSKTISCMFLDIDLRDQLRKPSFYLKILFNK